MDLSVDTICQLTANSWLIILLALTVVSFTTNDLFIFLFNICLQPFCLLIVLLREALEVDESTRCDYVYDPEDVPIHNFPSILHAELGAFFGVILLYNICFNYFGKFWLSKVLGLLLIVAIEFGLLWFQFSIPLYALSSFGFGIAFAALFVVFIWFVLRDADQENFNVLLQCAFCQDMLLQLPLPSHQLPVHSAPLRVPPTDVNIYIKYDKSQ